MWISSYIHTNAVKDKLAKHPREYKWSSYNDYTLDRNLKIINKKLLLSTFGDKKNFIEQNTPLITIHQLKLLDEVKVELG